MATKASTTGDARSTTVSKTLGHALVVGGTGFVGSYMCRILHDRSATTQLSAIDLRPPTEPIDGVDYHFGDITDEIAMRELFERIRPNVVIHTASPHAHGVSKEVMRKVNVDGTATLVKVAQETGVRAFVYTSSASVISDNETDLIYATEDYPLIMGEQQTEYYTTTKVGHCVWMIVGTLRLTIDRQWQKSTSFLKTAHHRIPNSSPAPSGHPVSSAQATSNSCPPC